MMFAFAVFGSQLILSHYNDTNISIYKMYKYSEDSGRTTISIEKIREHTFDQIYSDFNVDFSGIALVFTKPNNINVYQIKSFYIINYLMRLNFFKYKRDYAFVTNANENDIAYDRSESFLYIIMQNVTDPTERALFIFDFTTNSHNSLKTIVKLDRKYCMYSVAIYTEIFDNQSVKHIYLFYGGKIFQLIKFEPENVLVPRSRLTSMFLPYEFISMPTYSPSNVTLSIFPLLIDRKEAFRNVTLNLLVQSQNYGLMIEKRDFGKKIDYIYNDMSLNISLLDYFEGYNQNYAVMINNDFIQTFKDVISDISDDTYETFIIDSVSSMNYVTKAILFKTHYLLLFYSKNHLLQLYTVFDEIKKVGKDYNTFDMFHNCELTFINFIKLPRDFDFLVVQCLEVTNFIDASYVLKFFIIDINENNEIKVYNITSLLMNRKAKNVQVVNSSLAKEDLYVIILTNEGMKTDSIIYFVRMNCIQFELIGNTDNTSLDKSYFETTSTNFTIQNYTDFCSLTSKILPYFLFCNILINIHILFKYCKQLSFPLYFTEVATFQVF